MYTSVVEARALLSNGVVVVVLVLPLGKLRAASWQGELCRIARRNAVHCEPQTLYEDRIAFVYHHRSAFRVHGLRNNWPTLSSGFEFYDDPYYFNFLHFASALGNTIIIA